MYITMLDAGVLVVIVSVVIGFGVHRLLHKFWKSRALLFVTGSAVTLLLSYVMMSFFRFEIFATATVGLAFLVYVSIVGLSNERTGRLTHWAGISVIIILVAGLGYLFADSSKPGVDQTYLLPMGFEGCVLVNYKMEGAPPLKIEDNEIVYQVPDDGIIYTSSPADFGWVSKEHSGPHQTRAFYVDEAGNAVQELPLEKIRFGANGSMQEDGKLEKTYSYQLFGSEEVEREGCPALEKLR